MSNKHVRNKKEQRAIALHRITWLFHLAQDAASQGDFAQADRCVMHARNLSMRYLVPLPKELKRRVCSHCYRYLLPGVTSRVRVSRGRIITYCVKCQSYSRFPVHGR